MNRIGLPLAFLLLAACVQAFAQSYPARAVKDVGLTLD